MSHATNPFSKGAVGLLLLVGAGAFLLLLYAIGQGWDGSSDRNGGDHAASNSLNGFAGLVSLLEASGQEVTLSRNPADIEEYGLVVLTPPMSADASEIEAALTSRMTYGPTILVLPKWHAIPIPDFLRQSTDAKPGWVQLAGVGRPEWFEQLEMAAEVEVATGRTNGWSGLGYSGSLPDPMRAMALVEQSGDYFEPLVIDTEGSILAGNYWDDSNESYWPVLVVFEPDLLNNYGMADQNRAALAMELVAIATQDDEGTPIVFDLTFAGLGRSQNLLTLAFTPPFLAATLCLILAALVVAWRAFKRFGPPVAEVPALAQGKTQLARNGAGVLARARRWHLLTEPYALLITTRVAGLLAIRAVSAPEREAAIERALVRRGLPITAFPRLAHDLRNARNPGEILRAARALKSIERTLKR